MSTPDAPPPADPSLRPCQNAAGGGGGSVAQPVPVTLAAWACVGVVLLSAVACGHGAARRDLATPGTVDQVADRAAATDPSPPGLTNPTDREATAVGAEPSVPAEVGEPAAATPSALALGVFEVALPHCGTQLSAAEHDFCASASRAVRRAYEDDFDDPSVLLALSNELEVNPALGASVGPWRSPLGHALSRSEGLWRLGPTLRLLRRAVEDAYLDPVTQLYRGVNTEVCRAAFAQLPADEPQWLEMVVTVEPLGTYPLSRLRRFCLDSRTLGQKGRKASGRRTAATPRQHGGHPAAGGTAQASGTGGAALSGEKQHGRPLAREAVRG